MKTREYALMTFASMGGFGGSEDDDGDWSSSIHQDGGRAYRAAAAAESRGEDGDALLSVEEWYVFTEWAEDRGWDSLEADALDHAQYMADKAAAEAAAEIEAVEAPIRAAAAAAAAEVNEARSMRAIAQVMADELAKADLDRPYLGETAPYMAGLKFGFAVERTPDGLKLVICWQPQGGQWQVEGRSRDDLSLMRDWSSVSRRVADTIAEAVEMESFYFGE